MDNRMKIVRFEEYCPKCEHCRTDEIKDPCNECLNYSVREDTRQPLNFVKKPATGKRKKKLSDEEVAKRISDFLDKQQKKE